MNFPKIPKIYIGPGEICRISNWLKDTKIKSIILITGENSLKSSGKLDEIIFHIEKESFIVETIKCGKESNAEIIDYFVQKNLKKNIEGIIAVGGGSVIDLGKAISAMLPNGNPIKDYLGLSSNHRIHDGKKIPFLAIPTTSGTGAEATKNAVVTETNNEGYKISIRHENFVPDATIIDGCLLLSSPRELTISAGFDSLTQLLEVYFSRAATPFTDAVALSGLKSFLPNFFDACGEEGSKKISVRQSLGYAALCSGIGLANADLGLVHGIAVPLGAFFPIPHGIACGTLLGACLRGNLKAMKKREPNNKAILKMMKVGKLFKEKSTYSEIDYEEILFEKINFWTTSLNLPRLSKFGISNNDLNKIVESTTNRNNPIFLKKNEIKYILESRL